MKSRNTLIRVNPMQAGIVSALFFLTSAGAGEALELCADLPLEGSSITLRARCPKGAVSLGTTEQLAAIESMSMVDNDGDGDEETVRFTGVNVQVVSGSGSTDGDPDPEDSDWETSVNGLGNLIVGYDEYHPRASDFVPLGIEKHGPVLFSDFRVGSKRGSHNLVVGPGHAYTSFGGLVAGEENAITGESASVSGGAHNLASGSESSVSGGHHNIASGHESSVSGGRSNEASSVHGSVSGGRDNKASGTYHSSVSGGRNNVASGYASSVSGGEDNIASGRGASVLGGRENEAAGFHSSVLGTVGVTAHFDDEVK